MFPPHFYDYCIVKGMFYNSGRWTKSIQHRVMRFSEHVFYYPTYEVITTSHNKDELVILAERLDKQRTKD